jgi:hypothetical protein
LENRAEQSTYVQTQNVHHSNEEHKLVTGIAIPSNINDFNAWQVEALKFKSIQLKISCDKPGKAAKW